MHTLLLYLADHGLGGPIIDLDSGAVVGIIRGNSYAYGVSLTLLRLSIADMC